MKCPCCNEELEYVDIGGDTYHEHLFEDVTFEARHDGSDFSVQVERSAKTYLDGLGPKHWYDLMLNDLRTRDNEVFCPKCQEEFNLHPDGTTSVVQWIPIHSGQGMSMNEFIEELRSKSGGKPVTLKKLNDIMDELEEGSK